jgi:amino acid transporter
MGSSEALGIIFSLYNSALLASYVITIGCVLLHRLQGRPLPPSNFSLGKWGLLCNIIAIVYVLPIFIFSFFPSAPKPTPGNMNWAAALVGGIVILATGFYVAWGQHIYSPPEETVEDYIQRTEKEGREGTGSVKDGTGSEVAQEKVVEAEIDEKPQM